MAEIFLEESDTDDEPVSKKMRYIARKYLNNKNERALIDDVFITLCGWSFATLVLEKFNVSNVPSI